MQQRLNEIKSWLHSHPDVFLDLVRTFIGVALFFKGLYFMQNRDYLLQIMNEAHGLWFAPAAMAHYIVPAHLVGGLMLALGLLTRIAALAQIPILLGAIFYVHLPTLAALNVEMAANVGARQNLELSVLTLFLAVLLCLHGSGRFSLEHAIEKGRHAAAPAPSAA
jgi:putative oxidoreductase